MFATRHSQFKPHQAATRRGNSPQVPVSFSNRLGFFCGIGKRFANDAPLEMPPSGERNQTNAANGNGMMRNKMLIALSTLACCMYSMQAGNLNGENVERSHEFNIVRTPKLNFGEPYFQLRALPNGGFNYIVYQDHSTFYRRSEGMVCMVVFDDEDVRAASAAFRTAFNKAREWIKIGRKNNKTLTEFKDMGISIPEGCAVEIPPALDKWVVFHKVADISSHKKMNTSIQFCFSTEERKLLLKCGEVSIVFEWYAKEDNQMLANLSEMCNADRMMAFYKGNPGESSLFSIDQKYKKIPVVKSQVRLPEWDPGYISVLADFPGNISVTFSKCQDNSYNYGFGPYKLGDIYNTNLIFPNDSYDAAYRAIDKAFMIALAWRDIARKNHVVNIVKEINVPCPDSASVRITGRKGYFDVFRQACMRKYLADDMKATKLWFVVETEAKKKDDKYYYNSENSSYYLYFGNKDVQQCLELDEQTIAAFKLMDPQVALRKAKEKAKSDDIFR